MKPQDIFNQYAHAVGEALYTPKVAAVPIKKGEKYQVHDGHKVVEKVADADGYRVHADGGLVAFLAQDEFEDMIEDCSIPGANHYWFKPDPAVEPRRYLELPTTMMIEFNFCRGIANAGNILCDLGKGAYGIYDREIFKRDNTRLNGTLKYDA